jgi:hypothetical protein
MGPVHQTWICRQCGTRSEICVAPDASGRCERCIETSGFERSAEPPRAANTLPLPDEIVDNVVRRRVVARLRARYAAARDLVSPAESDVPSHAHLEWILGARRHPDRDDANLSESTSELIVLWLEDLVLALDGPVPAPCVLGSVASQVPAGDSRETAALGLRVATRDFASTFLTPRAQTVGGP